MLTGKVLGKAIREAIARKKVTQVEVAKHFGVRGPSVQDWLNRGTIGKEKLSELWAYFSDVVGPEHWGLASYPSASGMVPHVAEPTVGTLAGSPPIVWPFELLSYGRLNALRRALGAKRYNEAVKDLDNQLDIVLTKWEREASEKRAQAAA